MCTPGSETDLPRAMASSSVIHDLARHGVVASRRGRRGRPSVRQFCRLAGETCGLVRSRCGRGLVWLRRGNSARANSLSNAEDDHEVVLTTRLAVWSRFATAAGPAVPACGWLDRYRHESRVREGIIGAGRGLRPPPQLREQLPRRGTRRPIGIRASEERAG